MTDDLRVIVSGGSMGGLFTALALGEAGHGVDVFERAAGELESRGAGIVAQPRMLQYLEERGIASEEITLTTQRREYLKRDGSVREARSDSMTFTGWDTLYRRLRKAVDDERYYEGRVVGFEHEDEEVSVRFEDGSEGRADLLTIAEGGRSETREQLLPEVSPEYAGYVAWRGLIDERELSESLVERFEGTFLFFEGDCQLILGYLIPGPDGGTRAGTRRLNWVWYDNVRDEDRLNELLADSRGVEHDFSVAPGDLRGEVERGLRASAEEFPDVFSRLVGETENPFVQTIYDLSVPEMAFDRVCLLGDAAFVARPHTAAGTAKAAADAIDLGRALDGHERVESAFEKWEGKRLAAGRQLVREGIRMGESYMG
ncbi:FAD binding domain-containing protein [Halalkalicoccus sp. NIPERK01]|uniref:FAD binding domain-containing protein n=1 Tax=Halalkalicoccus sp. NIPERK01 TaxID=3053469 RepID=UPI00256F5A8B|nr:FAD binding domain-containing protein [Halalkalicoccus sp. NIPERK01]MDL5362893.1 FAD binding domain-containing protein [Halalkalicoccus sp. NIPERK01]